MSDQRRLAVLPFDNFTDDPELQQLGLGLADAVITTTTWSVVPRSASFRYADAAACEAAKELNAGFVLEGSVNRVGDRVRVAAQLFDCRDVSTLWTDTYDSEASDLLALQDEIAVQIVRAAGRALWLRQQRGDPGDGFWHLNRKTRQDNQRALALFQELAESDLTDPDPPGLVLAYQQRLKEGWEEPGDDSLAEIRRVANRCLELDPLDGGCHYSKSVAHKFAGERDEALSSMRRSLELQPGNLSIFGLLLAETGQAEEAVRQLEEAIRLRSADPEVWRIYAWLGLAHFAAGDYTDARDQVKRGIGFGANDELNNRADAYLLLAASHGQLGEVEEA